MEINEILKKLVETESIDERMNLVEENQSLFQGGEVNTEEVDGLRSEMENLKSQLEEQKKRYRDRFFSGSDENEPKDEEKEDEKEEVKSLEDLGM